MTHHSDALLEKWSTLSLSEQLANVGSEVSRATKWQTKNKDIADRAYERMLELLNATISHQKKGSVLKELTRLRELMNSSYYEESQVALAEFNSYFIPFAVSVNTGK